MGSERKKTSSQGRKVSRKRFGGKKKKIFILDLPKILGKRNIELGFREPAELGLRTDALASEISILEAQYPSTEPKLVL